jgi:hypothetical protein
VYAGFFAALHEHANAGEIADFAGTFQADDIHVAGGVKQHNHIGADNTGDAYGSANLKACVGLDEFHGCRANLAVREVEIGLLLAGVVLGDGEI